MTEAHTTFLDLGYAHNGVFFGGSLLVLGAVGLVAWERIAQSSGASTSAGPATLAPGVWNVVGYTGWGNPETLAVSPSVELLLTAGETLTEDFVVPFPTTLTYTGATQGAVGDPVLVGATLLNGLSGSPIAGQAITFAGPAGQTGIGLASCSAVTNSSGSAAAFWCLRVRLVRRT